MTSGSGRRRSISVLIYASGSRPDGWQCGILVRDGSVFHNLLASAAYGQATVVLYSGNSCQSCYEACKWCTNCLSGRVNYSYWFIDASTLRIPRHDARIDTRRYWWSRRNIDINIKFKNQRNTACLMYPVPLMGDNVPYVVQGNCKVH